MPSESFAPFLKRPSFYQDEGIQLKYNVDFVPGLLGKKVIEDKDTISNLMEYLSGLNLETSSKLVSINDLRNELTDSEKMKSEIAKKVKEESAGESAGEDMGGEPALEAEETPEIGTPSAEEEELPAL